MTTTLRVDHDDELLVLLESQPDAPTTDPSDRLAAGLALIGQARAAGWDPPRFARGEELIRSAVLTAPSYASGMEMMRTVGNLRIVAAPGGLRDQHLRRFADHPEARRALEAKERQEDRVREAEVAARFLGHSQPLPIPTSVSWPEEWDRAPEEVEWLAEPLIPARRSVSLYSAPKVGKSLLLLELAAGIAAGRGVLGAPAGPPRHVLYVDLENSLLDDVIPRLKAMGYDHGDLSSLHYLSFPDLAALDSPTGAEQLMRTVAQLAIDLVVVDTMSRTHQGEENSNDTALAWHRLTGARLKAAGVALVRLDHSGHEGSHARGASAKGGDVDAIWFMSAMPDDRVRLQCKAARFQFAEEDLVLQRVTEPHLQHRVIPRPASHVVAEGLEDQRLAALRASGLDPATTSVRDAEQVLRGADLGGRSEHLRDVIRSWKGLHPHDDEDQS